jgi:negative regulator of sigma E activity
MTTGVDSTLANFSNNGANKGDYDLEQLNSGNQSIVQFVSNTININRQVVPKGYQLSWYDQLSKNSQGTSEMMIISNGIKPVTVYVDKNNNQHINNVFSKQLNGFKITVVGEASNVTLRSIGDAIVVPDKAMNK